MLPIAQPLQQMIQRGVQNFATLWKIERTDGTVLLFTDHDSAIILTDGIYKSAGGFSASARQKTGQAAIHNMEAIGIIDNADITQADLAAGRYRDAKITESVVDWRYPWAGNLYQAVWWIGDITYTDGQWKAQVSGLGRFIQQSIGRVYTRMCQAVLGDSQCTIDLTPFTKTIAISSLDTTFPQKIIHTASSLSPMVLNDFTEGLCTFTSGANAGYVSEIKGNSGGGLVLYLSTPFPIVIGDTATIVRGCLHTFDVCTSVFSNGVNYRGFPRIPGQDALLNYPNSHV